MKKFKIPYKCIIYEEGDIVFPKYPNEESKPMLIVGTRLDIIGHNTVTQFLRFDGCDDDLNVSNFYVPFGEKTRNKYADGLQYFETYKNGKVITNTQTKVVPIDKPKSTTKNKQSEITFKPIKKSP